MNPSQAYEAVVYLLLIFLTPVSVLADELNESPSVHVMIEKAVSWSELEQLLGSEASKVPARPTPPTGYTVQNLVVTGEVRDLHASLLIEAEIHVLESKWVVVPILPAQFSVSHAELEAPTSRTSILVRQGDSLALMANSSGKYRLRLETEGVLKTKRSGSHLTLLIDGVVAGRADIEVFGRHRLSGRTAWEVNYTRRGVRAVASLGSGGFDLVVDARQDARQQEDPSIEGLEAVTSVTLGGRGVMRVRFLAAPGRGKALDLSLPPGARPWRIYVGARSVPLEKAMSDRGLRIPLTRAETVEVAYTFDAPRLGLKGRFQIEMPRFPTTVRGARWDVWLPAGIDYREIQASLGPGSNCSSEKGDAAATSIELQGACLSFWSPALEPSVAFVEGIYEQQL